MELQDKKRLTYVVMGIVFLNISFVCCLWQLEVCLNAIVGGWAGAWNVMFTWVRVDAWAARDFFMACEFLIVFFLSCTSFYYMLKSKSI